MSNILRSEDIIVIVKENCMKNLEMEIYIFGASVGGKHVYDIFTNLGVKVIGFVDNNVDKWGTMFQNVMIYSPRELHLCSANQRIVIASTYHDEIREQLLEMGIDKDKIVMKDQIIQAALGLQNTETNRVQGLDDKIIFDLSEGFILSGVVNWSINLIEELYFQKKDVFVLAMKIEDCNYDYQKIADRICWVDYNLCEYRQAVEQTAAYIEEKLPCKIIINQISQVFWAACMVKQKYADKIEIVSVIHSDFSRIYEQNAFLDAYIDQYICVSKDIQRTMKDKYNIKEEKLHYHATSIEYDTDFIKHQNKGTEIHIAYAARLEKAQKRTDLLIPLMELLNNSGMEYRLNIAGSGTYYKKLEQYIQEQNLMDKVKLYGALSYDEMKDFWKENDVFVNLSDIEGMPVSLLEAMSWGVVPIVTKTSGIKETVEDGINGFVCDRESVRSVFLKIERLDKDREKLYKMSKLCRDRIRTLHDRKKYVEYLLECI